MLNPLVDNIFELIINEKVWMVHTLAAELKARGQLHTLDPCAQRDLFKRNFLIMNALYQLQQQVSPKQQLVIKSLHIELCVSPDHLQIENINPLRDYYLDWRNFDTSTEEVHAMLNSFWQRFNARAKPINSISAEQQKQLLLHWQLTPSSSLKEIQKRWRQLAAKHHPDKKHGDAELFKQLKNEYEQLIASCSHKL